MLTNALTDDGALGELARAELTRDLHWSAPEHLLVETYSGVRGRLLAAAITEGRAHEAVTALEEASVELLPIAPLLGRMWELRGNCSVYDAAYVAAAEACGCPLLTADRRLARTPGLRCQVRLTVLP